jgi:hypothetical protein
VCKYKELSDMSSKKYSDGVWKEKVWDQIGEELKKSGRFLVFFIACFEITIIQLLLKI